MQLCSWYVWWIACLSFLCEYPPHHVFGECMVISETFGRYYIWCTFLTLATCILHVCDVIQTVLQQNQSANVRNDDGKYSQLKPQSHRMAVEIRNSAVERG